MIVRGRSVGSLGGLRQRNRRRVLEVVRHRGTTSRADIAKQTGLSTTTVSTLVGELLDERVLVELPDRTGNGSSNGGRPARLLAFDPAAGGAVGVHLAHDHIRVGVVDLAGGVVAERSAVLDVDHEPQHALDHTAATVGDVLADADIDPASVVGLGVAVSAPVAAGTHALRSERILAEWSGVDIAAELGRRTGLPVALGNDANLGAIAEHRFGVAQGVDDFVYVMLSDGVGAGLVLGGQLYEGAVGGAGELGHVAVVPGGLVCRCGNRGCLETVVGARALTGAMSYTQAEPVTVADIVAAGAAGDPGAVRVLADAGRSVADALAPLCTVLDPALVVIGGECSASAVLIDGVHEHLTRVVTPLRRNPIPVRAGALLDRAEMLGAVALVTRRMPLG